MMDSMPTFAILYYSPDLELSTHRALLKQDGIDPHMLGTDDAAQAPPHVPIIYLLSSSWWQGQGSTCRDALLEALRRLPSATVVTGPLGAGVPAELEDQRLAAWLDQPISVLALRSAVRSAVRAIELRFDLAESQHQLEQRSGEMREMHRIGIALSSERDLDALQHLILATGREMTNADAGTLYLLEEKEDKSKVLAFHVFQNDSVPPPSLRATRPIDRTWLAGYVAATGRVLRLDDVYNLPPDGEYTFSPASDQKLGYRTRSLLVVPMRNHNGEVIGVIQLINRKRHPAAVLKNLDAVEREVVPFTSENEELLLSFASQAAVALDNKRLLDNIQALFKGFIQASIKAIEQRDPTTSGHSNRVAQLTLAVAHTLNDVQSGRWRDVHFNPEQLKEIEYAALLHDFGKIGVREQVLVKAKKLYDWKLVEVRDRFRYARKSIEHSYAARKLETLLQGGRDAYLRQLPQLDAQCQAELAELDQALQLVLDSNEPTILPDGSFEALHSLRQRHISLPDGTTVPLLDDEELQSLIIRKGSLNDEEREQINSHVTHTYNFLLQIPWTRELQGVPTIAYAHHEKLNGSGYPSRLLSDAIPLQAKMMTIVDIFDALTAQDRPYKRAVPLAKALDILGFEARDGNVDADLLDLFIERGVYRVLEQGTPSPGLVKLT